MGAIRRGAAHPALSLLLAAAAAITPRAAHALDPDKGLGACTVDLLRVRDGLPGGWVRAIAQSPDGHLWLATYGGVGRHDGSRIARIESAAEPGSAARLSDAVAVVPDARGVVWMVMTLGPPLCARGLAVGPCFSGTQTLPATERIAAVQHDAGGATWLLGEGGLYRYGEGRLSLHRAAADLPPGRWYALLADEKIPGRLWLAGRSGVHRHDPGASALQPVSLPRTAGATEGPSVHALARGRGGLWAATGGGLVQIALPSDEVRFHARSLPMPTGGRPTALAEDRDGNVWVGTREGLVRFSGGVFTWYTRRDGLPDDEVSAVFEDREGSLWVGTRGGGLAQFSDRTALAGAGPPSLRNDWIATLAEDPEGTLWVGYAGGLSRWAAGVERIYGPADGLPSDRVQSVLPDGEGGLWVGTDRGLTRLRRGSQRFDPPLVPDKVVCLHRDRGRLFLGTDAGTVAVIDPSAGPTAQLRWLPRADDWRSAEIRALRHDDSGTLWVAVGSALGRFDGTRLVHERSFSDPGQHIRSIAADPDGTLWLGTSTGLSRLRRGKLQHFGRAEGITPDDVFQVAPDASHVWMGTSHGLQRVSRLALDEVAAGRRSQLDLVSLDMSDERRDIAARRTNQPGVWRGRDGGLWFATTRGVVRVDPRRLRVNLSPPPVVIDKALVDGRAAARDGENRFPPGGRSLEFHFAAITLLEPQKARHRYQLEGFDDRWIDSGSRRVAYYTNIPPGHYRFRVEASNADGVWNRTGDAVAFEIAPHFYQTLWFYLVVALAAVAAVLGLHRLRVSRVRAEYGAVLAERARVARELHDALLQGMSGVAMQLRGLRKRLGMSAPPPPEALGRDLQQLEQVVAANVEETRRVVWDLREPPAGGAALEEALEAQLSAALASPTGSGVQGKVHVEGDPFILPPTTEHALRRIAGEAVQNALAHAQPRSIDVHLHYAGEELKLSVVDDGRGFDQSRPPGPELGHFGLQGMQERSSTVGTLLVESQPGTGTRVEITVPRPRRGPTRG